MQILGKHSCSASRKAVVKVHEVHAMTALPLAIRNKKILASGTKRMAGSQSVVQVG